MLLWKYFNGCLRINRNVLRKIEKKEVIYICNQKKLKIKERTLGKFDTHMESEDKQESWKKRVFS